MRVLLLAAGLGSAGFVACTATNEEYFDTSLKPLNPPMRASGSAGAGSMETPSQELPAIMEPDAPDPDPDMGSAGSGSTTRPPRPPRPPRPVADAGVPPAADAGVVQIPTVGDDSCGTQCGRNGGVCSKGTCFFDCQAPGSCSSQQVICPNGVPCDVTCGDNACTSNVLCNVNANCNIRCQGQRSCGAEVICDGECHVTCSGQNSCPGGTGGAAKLLDLKCTGQKSCGSTVQCEGQECRVACSGPQSCARVKIFATQNTLVCSGADSCSTSAFCNGSRCDTQCARNACANDVDCQALSCQVRELEDGED